MNYLIRSLIRSLTDMSACQKSIIMENSIFERLVNEMNTISRNTIEIGPTLAYLFSSLAYRSSRPLVAGDRGTTLSSMLQSFKYPTPAER